MLTISTRLLPWTTLVLLSVVLFGAKNLALSQEEKSDAKPAAAAKAKKFRGRLPNYYRTVVSERQRQAIYKIQEEYAEKIAALRAQLEAITKERNEKVEAVLTPEQLQKVEQLAAEAKAKREKKKAEKSKPATP